MTDLSKSFSSYKNWNNTRLRVITDEIDIIQAELGKLICEDKGFGELIEKNEKRRKAFESLVDKKIQKMDIDFVKNKTSVNGLLILLAAWCALLSGFVVTLLFMSI